MGNISGMIHLFSSVMALITGTLVLVMKKGTKKHIQIGYAYVVNMAILIFTAFLIYRLFGGWGIFHFAAVISLVTLCLGMIPIWTRKPAKKWKYFHFSFMYWSVIGLYSAFAAEILTRIPETPFFGMVGISFVVIVMIGGIYFKINKPKWVKLFEVEK